MDAIPLLWLGLLIEISWQPRDLHRPSLGHEYISFHMHKCSLCLNSTCSLQPRSAHSSTPASSSSTTVFLLQSQVPFDQQAVTINYTSFTRVQMHAQLNGLHFSAGFRCVVFQRRLMAITAPFCHTAQEIMAPGVCPPQIFAAIRAQC